MSHSWPKSCTVSKFQVDDLQARTFHLHRKFTRARHLWLSLRPNWSLMRTHMYTDWPVNYSYAQLNDRLFNNPGRNDLINDTPYQGGFLPFAYQEWQQQAVHGPVYGQWAMSNHNDFGSYLVEIRGMFGQGATRSGRTERITRTSERWRTRQGMLQVKVASPTSKASPIAVDAEFEEVLRDV